MVSSLFHFLLYVAKGSSSLKFSKKRTILNRISNLARVNLTHTLGAPMSHSQATVCFSFWFMDSATLPDYSEPDPLCSRSCCNINLKFLSLRESGGYVHLPGRSVTRLAAYHIYGMWLCWRSLSIHFIPCLTLIMTRI